MPFYELAWGSEMTGADPWTELYSFAVKGQRGFRSQNHQSMKKE